MLLAACLPAAALAQGPSCIPAATLANFNDCMQAEILPLEAKVVHLSNAVRAKLKPAPQKLRAFDRAQDGWNAYRNGECEMEAHRQPEGLDAKRTFAECTKRLLEARAKELEAL